MKQLVTLLCCAISTILVGQTFTTWTTVDGLPSDDLRDVAVAPDGTIWIASSQGVVAFDGNTFTVHNTTSHPGLASNDVQSIAVTSDGMVWAGTDFGVSVLDGGSYTTFTTADGMGDDVVKNVKEAPNGDIWIATINGATRISEGVFTAFASPNIPFGGTLDIAFADNDEVLFSGGLGGVIVYNGNTFSTVGTAQGLLSNRIRSIAVDDEQNKWVATAAGISILDAANVHTGDEAIIFTLPPPDELNPVTDLGFDPNGRLWAGVYVDYLVTVGGVSVLNDGEWTQFEEADGLAGPNVRRLVVEGNGDVWVTTSTGLTRISEVSIGIAEQAERRFTLYPNPTANGLMIQLETADPQRTVVEVRDAQGRLCQVETFMGRTTLDVSQLADGLYMARIGRSVQPFVVQH